MTAPPVPAGFHTVTPYLIVAGAAEALDFYKRAFGASELFRLNMPGDGPGDTSGESSGGIAHAEFTIGDSVIMLSDEHPNMSIHGPKTLGGTPVSLMVYVPDVDTLFAQALAAGAKELRPVRDQFYGSRSGLLEDPFGHHWTLATHKEDVPLDQLEARMKEALGG